MDDSVGFPSMAECSPAQARAMFRSGRVSSTAGWCVGHTQANLVSIPQDWAYDLLLFATRNPAPIPLLDVTEAGSRTTALAPDADLATDAPLYRVWVDGHLADEPTHVDDVWRGDLVTFIIGCSFSFEHVLARRGVPLRHVEQGRNVSMYSTARMCRPAGRFQGPLVVSMRPLPAALVPTAVRVTSRMPGVHGAPVHVGDPSSLGVANLQRPDFGDPVEFAPGDVPVFWACGVTPQVALQRSGVPFAITHAPGHMLVTDVSDTAFVID